MIGATTRIGTVVMEFVHKDFKVLRIKTANGSKKTVQGDRVVYRVTHCNLFQLVEGQEEAKYLASGVIQWPKNVSKEWARKHALESALRKVDTLDKEERKKVWVGYFTRGLTTLPSSMENPPQSSMPVEVVKPPIPLASSAWDAPAPPWLMKGYGHGV